MSLAGVGELVCYCSLLPLWYAIPVHEHTTPTLPIPYPAETVPHVIHLYLRQDPITGMPEWVSGHRMALAFYLEQLPVSLLVLHLPDAAPEPLWSEALERWLLEEFIPFVSPYEISYVALGNGWSKIPLTWVLLIEKLKQASLQKWGFYARVPNEVPMIAAWDFLCAAPSSAEELSLWKEKAHFLFLSDSLPLDYTSLPISASLLACIRSAPYAVSPHSAK